MSERTVKAHELVGRYNLGAGGRLSTVACEDCGRLWKVVPYDEDGPCERPDEATVEATVEPLAHLRAQGFCWSDGGAGGTRTRDRGIMRYWQRCTFMQVRGITAGQRPVVHCTAPHYHA
jgi:hypothetical protein